MTIDQLREQFVAVQAIHLAARLGLPARLRGGPRSTAALAEELGASPPHLGTLIDALAALGLVTVERDLVRLAATGELLLPDVPGSLHATFLKLGAAFQHEAQGHLLDAVKTGRSGFELAHGARVWDYLSTHPAEAAIYEEPTRPGREIMLPVLLKAYDFGRFRHVVDVGGGDGRFLDAILRAHPQLEATYFDLPSVAARATHLLDPALGGRCRVESGDFFAGVPAGGDAYVLFTVLMDWGDERAKVLLESCRAAMAPGGTIVVVNELAAATPASRLLDLELLVAGEGRIRSDQEWHALFAAAGLRCARIVRTGGALGVVEGVAA